MRLLKLLSNIEVEPASKILIECPLVSNNQEISLKTKKGGCRTPLVAYRLRGIYVPVSVASYA